MKIEEEKIWETQKNIFKNYFLRLYTDPWVLVWYFLKLHISKIFNELLLHMPIAMAIKNQLDRITKTFQTKNVLTLFRFPWTEHGSYIKL